LRARPRGQRGENVRANRSLRPGRVLNQAESPFELAEHALDDLALAISLGVIMHESLMLDVHRFRRLGSEHQTLASQLLSQVLLHIARVGPAQPAQTIKEPSLNGFQVMRFAWRHLKVGDAPLQVANHVKLEAPPLAVVRKTNAGKASERFSVVFQSDSRRAALRGPAAIQFST